MWVSVESQDTSNPQPPTQTANLSCFDHGYTSENEWLDTRKGVQLLGLFGAVIPRATILFLENKKRMKIRVLSCG